MFAAFLPVPDRVAFTVFGLDIMWYAIMLVSGMVAGTVLLYHRAPLRGFEKDRVLDYVLYCVPAGVVGSRIYYVVFQWDHYKDDPIEIFNIRNGGLAIHGGLLFGLGLLVILILRRHENILDWVDFAMPGIALAQAIGRWGNYFNSEAHGTATDLPWAIECDGQLVHPTFLYESLWCLLLSIFLTVLDTRNLKKRRGFRGQIACLYAVLYSLERFFVEGLRTDSLYLDAAHTIRQAQVVSVCLFVLGITAYFVLKKHKWPDTAAADETADLPETETAAGSGAETESAAESGREENK